MVKDPLIIGALIAGAAALLAAIGEWRHRQRVRRIAGLAFGPSQRPRWWARPMPLLVVVASAALVGGAAILARLPTAPPPTGQIPPTDLRHLVIALDVSPSMALVDAASGRRLASNTPAADAALTSRGTRARDLLRGLLARVDHPALRISVIAVYNGAVPVVTDTHDREVIANVLDDLPLAQVFTVGKTKLHEAVTAAADAGRGWLPDTASLVIVSDGDTLPAAAAAPLPAAYVDALVIGVGDVQRTQLISGHPSRQDALELQRLALRLGGTYVDGNRDDLPDDVIARLHIAHEAGRRAGIEELAVVVVAIAALLLALIPVLLPWFAHPRRFAGGCYG